MPSSLRLRFIGIAGSTVLLFVLLFAGCQETSEQVRTHYVDRHQDTFVFELRDRDRVVGLARELLAEHGFRFEDSADPNTLRTTLHRRVRYAVHVLPLRQRPGFLVQLVRMDHDADGAVLGTQRDEQLEWQLIQRADPDRALTIMEQANERADRVPARSRTR